MGWMDSVNCSADAAPGVVCESNEGSLARTVSEPTSCREVGRTVVRSGGRALLDGAALRDVLRDVLHGDAQLVVHQVRGRVGVRAVILMP